MGRDEVLHTIQNHLPELHDRHRVASISLFGSASRDQLRTDSDIDVLVSFNGPTTFRGYFALQDFLENILGRRIDLVTEKALRPELRPNIERDRVNVS